MGGMGMGGGDPSARSRRQLTTLVAKLNLLTGGLPFELSDEQSEQLSGALAKLEAAEELSGDEADAQVEAINTILSDEQKKSLDAIALPRTGGFGGGPGGGSPGGRGQGGGNNAGRRPPLDGAPAEPGAGPGGAAPSAGANPFREGDDLKRLQELLGRVTKTETPAESN